MGDATIKASQWRLVERGRVVLFTAGKYEGRLAAIAEIIDHKRVCRRCHFTTYSDQTLAHWNHPRTHERRRILTMGFAPSHCSG